MTAVKSFNNFRSLQKISDSLRDNKDEIINILTQNNWKHFSDYLYISQNYKKGILDDQFKRVFCRFYVLNGARGLTKEQQEIYFQILETGEQNLISILRKLYEIPGYGGKKKLYISFGTKLIHTLDESMPIYDGNVARVIGLTKQKNSTSLDEMVGNRMQIYGELKKCFSQMMDDSAIKEILVNLRRELICRACKSKVQWPERLISDMKLLDSSLWALDTVTKGNETGRRQVKGPV